MSRGPGKIQESILAALKQSYGEVQVNELCWRLGAPANAELATNFYKSFLRAVAGLEESGRVGITRRELVDVDEVVRVYPSKATTLQVKRLRERLLPVVKSYLDDTGERKFGPAKNELHVLSRKPLSPETCTTWLAIESQLLCVAARACEEAEKHALIALLSKGRSLFVPGSRTVSGSFGNAIGEFFKTSLASTTPDLSADLKDLYYECFDERERRKALLKDRLYAVVDFSTHRTHLLKDDFKKELLQREPDYIRSLPGHAENSPKRRFSIKPTRYSDLLESLLRRDVLSSFAFFFRPLGGS